MGNCVPKTVDPKVATEAASLNRKIEMEIREDQKVQQTVIKMLLLGAGESGKSTIFKQAKVIHGAGFSEEERINFRGIIFGNVITNIKTLVSQSNKEFGAELLEESKESKDVIRKLRNYEELDATLVQHIKTLWQDPGIKKTFDNRSNFQLSDNALYYFDRLDELAKDDYIPTEADVLHCRAKTTGIVEMSFIVEGTKLDLIDVGGQRNERKKWIFCFDGVNAVLFVASLSEYDQVLYEDNKTNRTKEALELFKETCNLKYFENTEFILLLNKRDLFEEKIKSKPLTVCFDDYKGSSDYATCAQYVLDKFLEQNQNRKRRIYSHFTCATDTHNVRSVFNDAKDIILRKNLEQMV